MLKILYEDESLIVCIKPNGILSQSDTREKNSMPYLLEEHLGKNCYIGTVHRLDKEAGGIMVYAKNREAAGVLSDSFPRNAEKRYFAIVKGCFAEKQGEMKDLLFRDVSKNKSYTVKRMRKGVREASLEYVIKDEIAIDNETYSLAEVKLHTGRTHQIRVQFSSRNHPLLGDKKYGGDACEKMALFSYYLSFDHPKSKERMVFSALPLCEVPWNIFLKT